jgi:ketosteroid isomerase-like protein
MQLRRFIIGAALLVVSAACGGVQRAALPAESVRDIRAVDSAYVAAWLRDDTAAVMATLASDAVMMPAGHHSLTTPEAIRGFWWPNDGSHTRLLAFVRRIDELSGEGDIAYVRGSDSLAFIYEKDSVRVQQQSRSMTLGVLRRGADGRWRISRMMWATRTE